MTLTISLAQMRVMQSDVYANLAKAREFIIEAKARGSDIIAFPEMWTTGFNFQKNIEIAPLQDKTIAAIAALAKNHKIWITGSILTHNPKGLPFNTAILFNDEGNIVSQYSKIHLFTLLKENEYEAPGDHLAVVNTPWGASGLAVCYDLRFPELFRSLALKGALQIFSPMAFPYPRLEHWKILIRARAIENQLFMIGVNQVGEEDWGDQGIIHYCGTSAIIDPWGKTIVEANDKEETLLTATIDLQMAIDIRQQMTVLKDRRPDLYELN